MQSRTSSSVTVTYGAATTPHFRPALAISRLFQESLQRQHGTSYLLPNNQVLTILPRGTIKVGDRAGSRSPTPNQIERLRKLSRNFWTKILEKKTIRNFRNVRNVRNFRNFQATVTGRPTPAQSRASDWLEVVWQKKPSL